MPAVALAQQRTVVVVYDDSGSMGNPQNPDGPWRYANYALQTLSGLLAPQDVLVVVRMSAPQRPIPIDLQNRAQQIAAIHRGFRASGQTPYAAVRQAMAELAGRTGAEHAAGAAPSEKWLIVITDGDFQLEPTDAQTLRAEIRAFVEATGARVVFMLIGQIQPAVAQLWVEEAQARRYEATSRAGIVEQMQRIAADITSRSAQGLAVQVTGEDLSVTTEFPLRRLTVLQQRARAEETVAVESARGTTGDLQAEPPLLPRMPAGSSNPIVGHITHVRQGRPDAVIPAGNVTLSFARAVERTHVQVLPEVAARLALWLTDARGDVLPDTTVFQLCTGDSVRVRATLLSPAGDTLIRQVRRLEQFDVQLQYGGDTRPLAAAAGRSYFEAVVSASERAEPISVSAAYPGYFNFRSQVLTLRGAACPARTLGVATTAWAARVTELDRAPPLELRPTADGVAVLPEELEAWSLDRVDDGRLPVDIERTAVGWQLRPRPRWGLVCFTPTGLVPIELELRSGSAREPPLRTAVYFRILDVPWWAKCGALLLVALVTLLFLAWLLGVLRKRRFCRGSEIVYQRMTGTSTTPGHTERLARGFVVRWLVPYVPERKPVNGLTFEAGARCSYVVIPRRIQSDEMYVAGERLEEPGKRSVRLPQGEALEIRRGRQREIYRYNLYRSSDR